VIRIVLGDEAQADALDAFRFYEERREGLGERFRDHLDIALSRIQETPELYPIVHRDLRRTLIERFPYVVLYRLYPGVIFIVAIMHAKQSPAVWKRRVARDEQG
jgi:plasmid stabilization system protein ParE